MSPNRLLALLGVVSAACGPDEPRPAFAGTRNDLLLREPDDVREEHAELLPQSGRPWGGLGIGGWRQATVEVPEVGRCAETIGTRALVRLPALAPRDRTIRIRARAHGIEAREELSVSVRLNGVGERTILVGSTPGEMHVDMARAAWREGENVLELELQDVPREGNAGDPVAAPAIQVAGIAYGEERRVLVDAEAGRLVLPPGTGVRYLIETRSPAQLHARAAAGGGRLALKLARVDPRTGEERGLGATALEGRELARGARTDLPPAAAASQGLGPGLLAIDLVWHGQQELELAELSVVERDRRARPPVVFLSIDTLGARHMSLYGYERPTTPRLDELAGEAVVFDRCLVNAPWTMPSYLSVMTGLYPGAHKLELEVPPGVNVPAWDAWRIADTRWTLAEMLRGIGYETAAFVDSHWLGERFRVDQGFDVFETGAAEISISDPDGGIAWIHHYSRMFLDSLPPERPFFLFIHALDAHGPYLPGEAYEGRFASPAPPDGWSRVPAGSAFQTYGAVPVWMARTTVQEGEIPEKLPLQPIVDRYDEAILKVDDYIGKVLDELRERGLFEDALIVISADHGESFDHSFYSHGAMWEDVVHVPLVIRLPGGDLGGTRISEPVQLVDLLPTLRAAVGLADLPLHGGSLLPLVRGGPAPGGPLFAEEGHCEQYMLVDGPWKLVVEHPGRLSANQSLLTHPRVPREWLRESFPELLSAPLTQKLLEDLSGRPDFGERIAELRALLDGPFVSLYRIDLDPAETRDLSGEHPDVVERMSELLAAERRKVAEARAEARAAPAPVEFSAEELEELRRLGYVGD